MNAACPLCGAPGARRVASLDTGVLAREYRRLFGIDVRCADARLYLERCGRCDLQFFTPPWAGDEGFYRTLQDTPDYYQADKPEYLAAAAHVTASDRVLEVGGGVGAFRGHIRCRSYRLLELNPGAVEIARRRGLDARGESVGAHARQHPEAFDVVCAFQVLEHVPDPHGFLASGLACLRPGGLLIVSVPGDESFVGSERHNVLNLPPHHATRWSDRALASLGPLLGLDAVAVHHDTLAPWHTAAYASNLVDRLLAGALLRPWEPLDPVLVRTPVRAARRLLRALPRPLVHLCRSRIRGHSTTAVFRRAR